jgi:predicted CXXCH cytochrome family protein
MAGVKLEELRGCGACHENSLAHSQDPETITPSNPSSLDKASQNAVCGKCHYSQEILGRRAINPRDRHGLLTNAGFEGHSKLLSCLECHSPHAGHSKMLAGARAHVCFKCHKSAIVTMGVFQPFNYLTFGKACQACHTVHGGSPVSKAARMGVGVCVVCHFGGIAITGGEE